MADVDNDNQKKRRLPLWMLGVVAADKITKAGSSDENVTTSKDSSSQQVFSKGKPVAGRHDKRGDCEGEAAGTHKNSVGCSTRKNTRISRQRGLESDKPEAATGLQKKKSKRKCEEMAHSVEELEDAINAKRKNRNRYHVEKSEEIDASSLSDRSEEDAEPRHRKLEEDLNSEDDLKVKIDSQVRCNTRKRKSPEASKVTRARKKVKNTTLRGGSTSKKQTILKKHTAESSDEIEGSSPCEGSEDEVDLTMDDLMNIAQEYVRADEEKNKAGLEDLESNATLTKTSNTSTYESRSFMQAAGRISEVSTCSMRESTSNITEKTKETTTDKGILGNLKRTGDPKTDMLAVFLGPSWNKSSADERNLDKFSDSIVFSQEAKKPIESQVLVDGDMPPPVMKKKSSLKDKVAMFLDL
ncbi:hypothetical protein H6P81_018183 [Aristolochia fimbriata]|uniref:Uncharacterized protein n=1 Tax=Aristolochia fimbriata TaxID=158543 RepID=A0AAV7E268_ARIFI|nr:hypothetical protein H6P81_018183 [Aristolochia fimbriata]